MWLRHTYLTRWLRPRCIPPDLNQKSIFKMDKKPRDWSQVKRVKTPFQVTARLTKDENDKLEKIVQRLNVSRAGYVKSLILGQPIPRASRRPKPHEADLRQLLGLMGKLGSNANQIARACNSGKIAEQHAAETLKGIRAEMVEMRTLLIKALNGEP